MANVDKYSPGSFCWFELATSDQDAAKAFYSNLFGWQAADMPMGPGEVYTMFRLEGRDTSGGYTLKAEEKAHGIPPHWGIYISVTDADAMAAKVAPAGGTVVAPPFDIFDVGRMAVIQDPTGAYFNLFQPNRHYGAGINSVPGTFCWADLSTRDVEKARKFYSEVFGWEIAPGEHDTSGYLHIKNGDQFIGGMPPAEHMPPGVPPHWMLYFYVTDVNASTAKVKELGGSVMVPPMSIEKVGNMSIVADPQGAGFALFTPLPRT
jgi:uncharacterized protein